MDREEVNTSALFLHGVARPRLNLPRASVRERPPWNCSRVTSTLDNVPAKLVQGKSSTHTKCRFHFISEKNTSLPRLSTRSIHSQCMSVRVSACNKVCNKITSAPASYTQSLHTSPTTHRRSFYSNHSNNVWTLFCVCGWQGESSDTLGPIPEN